MLNRGHYQTKQKDIILNVIRKKNNEFTIKEIYDDIGGSVGLTTIYRLVYKLVGENKINKYIGNDNITYYQMLRECDEQNHFYLKCERCSDLIHVDCDCILELYKHIIDEHGFKLNTDAIIINGICRKCLNEVKK